MKGSFTSKKWINSILLLGIAVSIVSYAYSTGITGMTLKNGTGCNCHGGTPTGSVMVAISGPDTILVNQTATYTVTISGGTLARGGTNIAASAGALAAMGGDLQLMGDELTHTSPKLPSSGTVSFQFQYTAPANQGAQTLYANGNSVNFNGGNDGDNWNFASNKGVTVLLEIPVELESFTAAVDRNNVMLSWVTATEVNNAGFNIYRKEAVEAEWRNIGSVSGSGSSTERLTYSYNDVMVATGNYNYKLVQRDFDGTQSEYLLKNEVEIEAPLSYKLSQNYPNPFNPSTKIDFAVATEGNVEIKIFNSIGSEVATIAQGNYGAGVHSVVFNGEGQTSGVYYYQLRMMNSEGNNIYKEIKKMILIK